MHEFIFDIRTPEEYSQGHLQGATLIPTPLPPLDQLQQSRLRENLRVALNEVPRDQKIFVYCKKGKRAKVAERFIRKLGYDVTNLGGVEEGWLAEQLRMRKMKLFR